MNIFRHRDIRPEIGATITFFLFFSFKPTAFALLPPNGSIAGYNCKMSWKKKIKILVMFFYPISRAYQIIPRDFGWAILFPKTYSLLSPRENTLYL